jgi:hypothetical protein
VTDAAIELVAEVLTDHTRLSGDSTGARCACGAHIQPGRSFVGHQAQAVVAALRVAARRPQP